MKAEDMRILAINSVNDQINQIKQQIKECASKGCMCTAAKGLLPATMQWLKDNGYKIDESEKMSFGFITISW